MSNASAVFRMSIIGLVSKYIKDSDRNVINIAVYFERIWVNSQLNYKLESIHVKSTFIQKSIKDKQE